MYYFLEYLAGLPLLARCGEPSQDYRVEPSLFQAWDNWNGEMMAVWEPETCRLEELAQECLGDDEIDRVFETVSDAVAGRLWQSWCSPVKVSLISAVTMDMSRWSLSGVTSVDM